MRVISPPRQWRANIPAAHHRCVVRGVGTTSAKPRPSPGLLRARGGGTPLRDPDDGPDPVRAVLAILILLDLLALIQKF
jgi:hypothetical protein